MRQTLSVSEGLTAVLLFFLPIFCAEHTIVPSTFPDACEVIWTIFLSQRHWQSEASSIYQTATVFHPFGASLLLHATVEGITLPLAALLGHISPQRIYSVGCTLCFSLNFIAALRLFTLFRLSTLLRTCLAIAITFHPYFIARLDGGQFNFLCFFSALLFLHAILAFHRGERSARIMVEGSVAGAAAVFTNPYYLYMNLSIGIAWLLYTLIANRRETVRYISTILLPFLVGLSPGAYKSIGALRLALSRTYTPDRNPAKHSADIISHILPGVHQLWGEGLFSDVYAHVTVNSAERGAYVGLSLFILLTVSLLVTKREGRPLSPLAAWCLLVAAAPAV